MILRSCHVCKYQDRYEWWYFQKRQRVGKKQREVKFLVPKLSLSMLCQT